MDLKANEIPNQGMHKSYPAVIGGVPVHSFDEFTDLLISGHTEFMFLLERKDGKIIKEPAFFDAEDPMSYVLVEMLFERSNLCIYSKVS